MGLLLTTGEYIKIKKGTVTSNGMMYHKFESKEARLAVREEEMDMICPAQQAIVSVELSAPADSTKSIEDNALVAGYIALTQLVVQQHTFTPVKPFEGAIEDTPDNSPMELPEAPTEPVIPEETTPEVPVE